MRALAFTLPLALLLLVTACSPTVQGPCDEELARRPYYDPDGAPAYFGQALITAECAICHFERGARGATAGMELDLPLVAEVGEAAVGPMRHLRARQSTVHAHRDLVYQQVLAGTMPPRGVMPVVRYVDADGEPMPSSREPGAHELLRNWLACGAPVVERTEAIACITDADCPLTASCDLDRDQCIGVGDVVARLGEGVDCSAPEPTFAWIYPCVLSRSAAALGCSGCHVGAELGGLSLPDIDTAYTTLTTGAPDAASMCAGHGPYVVPSSPETSLLFLKLSEAPPCGGRMPAAPLPDEEIELIRAWIAAGAPRDSRDDA
jgi:hypothetical protein